MPGIHPNSYSLEGGPDLLGRRPDLLEVPPDQRSRQALAVPVPAGDDVDVEVGDRLEGGLAQVVAPDHDRWRRPQRHSRRPRFSSSEVSQPVVVLPTYESKLFAIWEFRRGDSIFTYASAHKSSRAHLG